jgi:hypothetical protein
MEGLKMTLPVIDVQLMNAHLKTHEGVLYKLRMFYHHAKHPTLKELIHKQYLVMESHVSVMLRLLNPYDTNWIELPHIDLNIVPKESYFEGNMHAQDKPIALEAKATAESMADKNFMSALMMKNQNVKIVHFNMADQQAKLADSYSQFIQNMWPEKTEMSSKETQLGIINEFQRLLQ